MYLRNVAVTISLNDSTQRTLQSLNTNLKFLNLSANRMTLPIPFPCYAMKMNYNENEYK